MPSRVAAVLAAAALVLAACQLHPDALLIPAADGVSSVIESSSPRPVTVHCEDAQGARYMAHNRCNRGDRQTSTP